MKREKVKHYNSGEGMETIAEMKLVFGLDATIDFCKLNVWKYRARAPYKGQTDSDMRKADQYMLMLDGLMKEKAGK